MPNLLPLLAALVQTSPAPRPDDFAATFNQATTMISQYFYDQKRKESAKVIFGQFAPKAKAAGSRVEFGRLMNDMIAQFEDSHFAFLGDDEQGYYLFDGLQKAFSNDKKAAPMPHFGAWFRREGARYFVQMVLNGEEAERVGLRKGDELLTVAGQPFQPVVGWSNWIGQDVPLTVKRGSKTLSVTVKPKVEPAMSAFLRASRNSARVVERDGKRIGYFHLWTQGTDDFIQATHNAVARMMNTDAFILDLRDGFGGRPEKYADPFFRPGVKLEWTFGNATQVEEYGYTKPLIVLINEGSRSAKEVLSYILKKSKRGTLVGHTTAGAVLGTTPMRLNSWAFLEIPMVQLKVDGETLEDKGVAPDIAVPQETGANGEDLILEAGVKTALEKIAASNR